MNKIKYLFRLVNRYFKLHYTGIWIENNIQIKYNKKSDYYIITCPSAERVSIKGKASSGEILLCIKMLMPY